jgi:ArsR family transcriptional regulator
MRDLTKAMKALADETRLRILNILLERECCVCEIIQTLNISESRASRNLRILYDAEFLKLRKDGLWTFYSIDKGTTTAYSAELIEAVRLALADNKLLQREREMVRRTQRLMLNKVGQVLLPVSEVPAIITERVTGMSCSHQATAKRSETEGAAGRRCK